MRVTVPRVLAAGAIYVTGLAATYALGVLLPGLDFIAFIVGFLLWIAAVGLLPAFLERRWVFWCTLVFAAITGLATVMLAGDVALRDSGTPTQVIVTGHTVQERHGANGTTYTHTYKLRRVDGRPLGQEMTYHGESGFDGADTGARLTVLVDPEGTAPVRPAADVDLDADTGILTVGAIGMAGVLTGCVISVRRRDRIRR